MFMVKLHKKYDMIGIRHTIDLCEVEVVINDPNG